MPAICKVTFDKIIRLEKNKTVFIHKRYNLLMSEKPTIYIVLKSSTHYKILEKYTESINIRFNTA